MAGHQLVTHVLAAIVQALDVIHHSSKPLQSDGDLQRRLDPCQLRLLHPAEAMDPTLNHTCLYVDYVYVARFFLSVPADQTERLVLIFLKTLFLYNREEQPPVIAEGGCDCICFLFVKIADLFASFDVVEEKATVLQAEHHVALVDKNECLRGLEVLDVV